MASRVLTFGDASRRKAVAEEDDAAVDDAGAQIRREMQEERLTTRLALDHPQAPKSDASWSSRVRKGDAPGLVCEGERLRPVRHVIAVQFRLHRPLHMAKRNASGADDRPAGVLALQQAVGPSAQMVNSSSYWSQNCMWKVMVTDPSSSTRNRLLGILPPYRVPCSR